MSILKKTSAGLLVNLKPNKVCVWGGGHVRQAATTHCAFEVAPSAASGQEALAG